MSMMPAVGALLSAASLAEQGVRACNRIMEWASARGPAASHKPALARLEQLRGRYNSTFTQLLALHGELQSIARPMPDGADLVIFRHVEAVRTYFDQDSGALQTLNKLFKSLLLPTPHFLKFRNADSKLDILLRESYGYEGDLSALKVLIQRIGVE